MRLWRPRSRTSPSPPVPVNVHIQWSTGEIEPVDCVYSGQIEHGVHRWTVILREPPTAEHFPTGMGADVLPAKTQLAITWDMQR